MSNTNDALAGLTTAVSGIATRIDEDVQHLNDLLEEALAASAEDEAEAARLREEAAAAVASITEATSQLNAIDPVAGFPAAPPVEPPVEPPA